MLLIKNEDEFLSLYEVVPYFVINMILNIIKKGKNLPSENLSREYRLSCLGWYWPNLNHAAGGSKLKRDNFGDQIKKNDIKNETLSILVNDTLRRRFQKTKTPQMNFKSFLDHAVVFKIWVDQNKKKSCTFVAISELVVLRFHHFISYFLTFQHCIVFIFIFWCYIMSCTFSNTFCTNTGSCARKIRVQVWW